jgi:hypothetical protein
MPKFEANKTLVGATLAPARDRVSSPQNSDEQMVMPRMGLIADRNASVLWPGNHCL